jgi:hypothetical protein
MNVKSSMLLKQLLSHVVLDVPMLYCEVDVALVIVGDHC